VPKRELVVLEKEATVGGLCRSEEVDGAPLDIGGGHFLDVRNRDALKFLFQFLPEAEWKQHERIAQIRLNQRMIDHPLETNLWQLSVDEQVRYLDSIARAGIQKGDQIPAEFCKWITWKLGECIANEYMLPYNRKIWSMDLDLLGTYWLAKLPDVSFRETLRSCLESRPLGTLPAHGQFLYPKRYGYGEVWRRMGVALGDALVTNSPVERVDLATRTVNGNWQAEKIINTIPWSFWRDFSEVPDQIRTQIDSLRQVAIDVDYNSNSMPSQAHWIYEPDESIAYHRILLRSNFCENSRGLWTETNAMRSKEPSAGGTAMISHIQ